MGESVRSPRAFVALGAAFAVLVLGFVRLPVQLAALCSPITPRDQNGIIALLVPAVVASWGSSDAEPTADLLALEGYWMRFHLFKAAGYTVSVVREEASDGVTGTVLRTSPEAGSALAPGSRVTLVVLQVVAEEEPAGSNCTPGYDPCLPPASNYDCAGGSGNGPKYVEGPVRVTGSDPYRLDADHDGIGCE